MSARSLSGLLIPAAGLVVALFLGRFAVKAMNAVRLKPAPELTNVEGSQWELWAKATANQHSAFGGELLGTLEVTLIFSLLWLGSEVALGAWLAFKLAVKWEAWTNIVVPGITTAAPFRDDEIRNLWARHRWGVELLRRFLIGTLWNVLSAGAGVVVGRVLKSIVSPPTELLM